MVFDAPWALESENPNRCDGYFNPILKSFRYGGVPFYNQGNLHLYQEEADKLKERDVLVDPEEVGVIVKFASPSFLRTNHQAVWGL